MNQREYGRGGADAQRERENGGRGKDSRGPELPQRVAKFAE